MKFVHILLCTLMILFAGVQYNDPDGLFWAAVYLVPACWAGLAAIRPNAIRSLVPSGLLIGCLILGLYGTFHYWPKTPEFWRMDVWWETETAREGMGMAIALLVLLVVALSVWWPGSGTGTRPIR